MDAATASAEALSVIGFFLTLVSLLGSFFYIHLSDWLRDVIALETKWDFYTAGTGADKRAALRECRYDIGHLATRTTFLTSLAVSVFIIFIFVLGANLWLAQPEKSVAWTYIAWAGGGFLLIYVLVTGGLLLSGYCKVKKLNSAGLTPFSPPKKA